MRIEITHRSRDTSNSICKGELENGTFTGTLHLGGGFRTGSQSSSHFEGSMTEEKLVSALKGQALQWHNLRPSDNEAQSWLRANDLV